MASRRKFLKTLLGSGWLYLSVFGNDNFAHDLSKNIISSEQFSPLQTQDKSKISINRKELTKRNNPTLQKLDPLSPLSVGNGEFAFTADITGLQTFPSEYENAMPLCTMSQWGWHSSKSFDPKALRLTQYDTYGRQVGYQTSSEEQAELFNGLRENPHRLHLGQIGLHFVMSDNREAKAKDIYDVEQTLDLWSGIITSRFKVDGKQVTVKTAVHPVHDLLAVSIVSTLIDEGRLSVKFAFPYGSPTMQAADWKQPEKHKSIIVNQTGNSAVIQRKLDADEYAVMLKWMSPASFTSKEEHHFNLTPSEKTSRLEFCVSFAPRVIKNILPDVSKTFAESSVHWKRFWMEGAVVDLSQSSDARANELERRVVLSQYLTAIQCSGSKPPQETGLTVNSWYGKFHLEMHWWHAAHFALWNRLPLLERSLDWYSTILPSARELAKSQGYKGVRFPKMVGPEGRDSPSPIGPLLIWQQPHPIFYAELCYKVHPNRKTLEQYKQIVFEAAEFMASYAYFDKRKGRYVLGPPLIPAQENHPPRETWNPTFELEYWTYGLKVAQAWRERLGMKRNPHWDDVINKLSPLPVKDGVYLAHENCPQTYTERNHDHPSMLGAFGMLQGDMVDRETMRRTLKKVMKEWQWDKTWGWDYPLTAMTAARLNEPEIAVDALLMDTEKNRYLTNGHNWQRPNLPCYLPGNGGLLYVIAMMAAGWKDSPNKQTPGFPQSGWTVLQEGFNASLLQQL